MYILPTQNLSWEVTGTKGAIAFTQERMNELMIYAPGTHTDATPGRDGFTKIEAGPGHPPYGHFCPAPGHHLGFNDLKIIEVAELLTAYAGGGRCFPDFREACQVQRTVEAMQTSSAERCWIQL
jgi:predicted dehydrogenase